MANAIHQMISEESGRASVDPHLALAIAAQESNFNPTLGNPRSSAFGVYQFINDNWKDYGIDPRDPITRDPQTQVRLGVDRIRQNRDGLSVFLGRSPEHGEVYMAHVFGLRGAQTILGASDDTPLRSVRPAAVFDANPWIEGNGVFTVGQMKAWMRNKTDQRLAQVQGLIDPTAVTTPWGDPTALVQQVGQVITGDDAMRNTRVRGRADFSNVLGAADERLTEANMASWPLHNFRPEQFRSRDGEPLNLSMRAAVALDNVAGEFGGPVNITSGHRSRGHNALVGGANLSRHVEGDAFDVDLSGMDKTTKERFLLLAMKAGFTSFGFYTNSPDMLHVDMRERGAAWFRGEGGRNFLQWAGDGSPVNFPSGHWAASTMQAFYRQGMKGPTAEIVEAARSPAQMRGATVEQARTGIQPPGLQLPPATRGPVPGVSAPTPQDSATTSPFTTRELRAQEDAERAARPGLYETAQLATSAQWSLLWAADNINNRFSRDPAWTPTQDWIKTNLSNLPTRFWDGIQDTVSEAHAAYFVQQANKAHAIEQKLGSLGWGGVAANLAAAILDPTALGLAIGSEGALAPWLAARKIGRVGTILAQGTSAGAQNVGIEALLQSQKPGGDLYDLLYAGAGGLVLGAAFAARPGALLRDEFERLASVGHQIRENLDAGPVISGSGRSVGAAVAPVINRPLNQNASEALAAARANPAAKTWGARARYDSVAQTLNSKHPLAAQTMDGLGEDAVGRAGHEVNTLAATEYQTWYHRRHMNEFYRVATPAWREYAEEQGLKWYQFRERAAAYDGFMDSITRRIRDVDAEVSPQAAKVVTSLQDRYEIMLRDLKEPGKADGVVLPPVAGFESVKFNRQYTPRIWHGGKISSARAKFGDEKMEQFLGQAYLARNPQLLQGGALQFVEGTKLGNLFGKTMWKRLREHKMGTTDDLSRALSGDDLEALKAQLYSAVDDEASKLDIDKIVDGLRVADGSGMARAQQRAMLDENFTARMVDANGDLQSIRLDDLLENNAERLFGMYTRNISGSLAMARLGYSSMRDFERRLEHIKKSADEVKDYGPNDLNKDIRNLEYLATYISGSPVGSFGKSLFEARSSTFGEYARVVRDLNFLRLMGQLGFAQAAETFSILGHVGIKTAFESMPSFRSLWRDARSGKLNDELANELEVWVGLGTDRLRRASEFRHEDFGHYLDPDHGQNMAYIRGLMERGKIGLGEVSGANMVNTVLHRWAMRSIAQKFADVAHDPKAWNAKRLAAYGLDPDSKIAKDIFAAIKEHGTFAQSAVNSKKLTQFNLDKWNPHTAEEFSLVMHRSARHVIQENDPGNMHAFMSRPGVQLITQFRNFMIVAHSKQLLHALHMRDTHMVTTFLGTSVSAGLAYTLQSYANSVGQRDREKFLKERLSLEKIGAASFSRAGWSALMPTALDNVASYTGFKTPFGTRTSGLQPTGLLQNPSFDFVNSLAHIPMDVLHSIRSNYDWSEQDFKRFYNVLPFKNVIGISTGLNVIGQGLPEKSRP